MTAITHPVQALSIRVPAWLGHAVVILALGLAVLALGEAGLLAQGVTVPLSPGAPDLAGRFVS